MKKAVLVALVLTSAAAFIGCAADAGANPTERYARFEDEAPEGSASEVADIVVSCDEVTLTCAFIDTRTAAASPYSPAGAEITRWELEIYVEIGVELGLLPESILTAEYSEKRESLLTLDPADAYLIAAEGRWRCTTTCVPIMGNRQCNDVSFDSYSSNVRVNAREGDRRCRQQAGCKAGSTVCR